MPGAGPLLILATVLVAGTTIGAAARRLRLPSVTGQILAGALIGGAGLSLFPHEAVEDLRPFTNFALGLIAVTVGAHLNLRKLRNAEKRLLTLVALEAVCVIAFVGGPLWGLPEVDGSLALLFGTLAISTAPATVVALVKETRSRGCSSKPCWGRWP